MPKAIVVYDSRTGTTERLARTIQEVLHLSGVEVTLRKVPKAKVSELEAADAVIVGSPEYMGELTAPMNSFLIEMQGVDLKGKIGAAFGAYGWDGEAIESLADTMVRVFGMETVGPVLKVLEKETDLSGTKAFARKIAERLQSDTE